VISNLSDKNISGLKIVHQNVCSLFNKLERIELLLEAENPDLFVITEHGLKTGEINCINLNNMKLQTSYCRLNKTMGGVAIYANIEKISTSNLQSCNIVQIDVSNQCSEGNIEMACVKIKIGKDIIIVLGIYRPPKSNAIIFFNNFNETIDKIYSELHYKIIIIGDFNIDFLKQSANLNKMVNVLDQFKLRNLINEPTRITEHSKTAIDNIITNIPQYPNNVKTQIIHTLISDHTAQCVELTDWSESKNIKAKILENKYHSKNNNRITCRNNSVENTNKLLVSLKTVDWGSAIDETNVNRKYELFVSIFLKHYNWHCPEISKIKNKNRTKLNGNWKTPEIDRIRTMLEIAQYKISIGENINKDLVNKIKQTYDLEVVEAKKRFYAKSINSSNNKSKASWNIINKYRGKEGKSNPLISLEIGNEEIIEEARVAEEFNNFFVSIGQESKTTSISTNSHLHPSCNRITSNLFLYPTSKEEILNIIKNIKTKHSVGHDNISIQIIKLCGDAIAEPLNDIANSILKEGIFPDSLKIAKVIPIFKKGNKLDVNNYRPISILPAFSKILERVILVRILSFLKKHNLMSPCQHGFTQGKSTNSALVEFMERIIDEVDKGKYSIGAMFDLTKAFNYVHTNTLLTKLYDLGIRGVAHDLIKSYLSNRYQYVCIPNNDGIATSTYQKLESGVPQGSILGPVLFTLYINDIQNTIPLKNLTLYADDTTALISNINLETLEIDLNTICNSIVQYFNSMYLTVNPNKCEIINFSLKNNHIEPTLYIGDQLIKSVNSTTVLGLKIDSKLLWTDQVNNIANKVSKGLFVMKYIMKYIPQETAKIVYYAVIYSHMAYGIELWGSTADIHFQQIFKLQKKAIRYIAKLGYRESCREHFKTLSILTLPCIYIYRLIIYSFNNKNTQQTNADIHSHNTRGKHQLAIQRHRLHLFNKKPSYMSGKLFNKLPNPIKCIDHPKKFKAELFRFLVKKAFYSIEEYLEDRS
jgi:hypothetical protein